MLLYDSANVHNGPRAQECQALAVGRAVGGRGASIVDSLKVVACVSCRQSHRRCVTIPRRALRLPTVASLQRLVPAACQTLSCRYAFPSVCSADGHHEGYACIRFDCNAEATSGPSRSPQLHTPSSTLASQRPVFEGINQETVTMSSDLHLLQATPPTFARQEDLGRSTPGQAKLNACNAHSEYGFDGWLIHGLTG